VVLLTYFSAGQLHRLPILCLFIYPSDGFIVKVISSVKIFGQTSKSVGEAYINGRSPMKYLNILARPETSLRWRPRLVVFLSAIQKNDLNQKISDVELAEKVKFLRQTLTKDFGNDGEDHCALGL